jgi:hypothetical protein
LAPLAPDFAAGAGPSIPFAVGDAVAPAAASATAAASTPVETRPLIAARISAVIEAELKVALLRRDPESRPAALDQAPPHPCG